jgi:hypothetical protein
MILAFLTLIESSHKLKELTRYFVLTFAFNGRLGPQFLSDGKNVVMDEGQKLAAVELYCRLDSL